MSVSMVAETGVTEKTTNLQVPDKLISYVQPHSDILLHIREYSSWFVSISSTITTPNRNIIHLFISVVP